MENYNKKIEKDLNTLCNDGIVWENEFGGFNLNSEHCFKENYAENYKILFHKNNFKIVPKYFSIPNSHYYWSYYDGLIENDKVLWNRLKHATIKFRN